MERENQRNVDSQKDNFTTGMAQSTQHRVNARSQVRPKRYRTYSTPKIIESHKHMHNAETGNDTRDNFTEVEKRPKLVEAPKISTSESKETSNSGEMSKHIPCQGDTESLGINIGEQEVAGMLVEDTEPEPENDLIDFIKQQETTLIDDLLQNLDMQNQWTADRDTEHVGFDSEEEDNFSDKMSADAPIQPGHSISTKVAVLVIWMYAIMHSITSEQLSDLLTIINIFLLHKNQAFQSLYRFKNFFTDMKLPAQRHYFCSNCMAAANAVQKNCPNLKCNRQFTKSEGREYFISLSIESQLQNFFKRSEFREGIKHRFKRSKTCSENIEDVYDSVQYRKLFDKDGPLSNPNNLSFILNTDGVPVFKSSKTSMWPIFLMINELPFGIRKSRDYMVLAGLWCGTTKPHMNVFLGPLQETLKKLGNGIQITTGTESFTIKGFLHGISCDMPARSTVLNINQHNGEFCCIKCLQSGKNHRTAAGGNIRVFPYSQEDPKGPERTHNAFLKHAQQAIGVKGHVCGVKGPSVVMFLPHFDSVKGVAIDYMHLVCLGIIRLLLNLWFNVSHSLKGFSLYKFTDIVDSRLASIKPPYFITRSPRLLGDMKFWKAAELRSWLFFYSVPCIMDLLKPNYLYHYCALLEAMFLLSKSSISEQDIQRSEKLLNYFVFMMAHLYDERYLTINVHSLVHLPDTVRELGPLWSLSCFGFEGANGDLLKLFHGTQYIDMQIINAVHVYQILPLIGECVSNQSVAYNFVNSLSGHAHEVVNKTCLLGKSYSKVLDIHKRMLICKFIGKIIQDLQFFKRASIRGVTFQSKDYTRVSKRNSYSVKFVENGEFCYGFITWFAEHEAVQFACINRASKKIVNLFDRNFQKIPPDCHIQNNFMRVNAYFLNFLEASNEFSIIPLKDIFELCICIEVDDYLIFCEEPNHQEKNL